MTQLTKVPAVIAQDRYEQEADVVLQDKSIDKLNNRQATTPAKSRLKSLHLW